MLGQKSCKTRFTEIDFNYPNMTSNKCTKTLTFSPVIAKNDVGDVLQL